MEKKTDDRRLDVLEDDQKVSCSLTPLQHMGWW